VYLAAFAWLGRCSCFFSSVSNLIFPDEHWFTPLEILLALSIAVMFHPLKTRIQLAFDRYLYREPYDYQRIIRETSRALSNTIELPVILDCAGAVIRDFVKPEWVAIYLLDEDEAQLVRTWETGAGKHPNISVQDRPLRVTPRPSRVSFFVMNSSGMTGAPGPWPR